MATTSISRLSRDGDDKRLTGSPSNGKPVGGGFGWNSANNAKVARLNSERLLRRSLIRHARDLYAYRSKVSERNPRRFDLSKFLFRLLQYDLTIHTANIRVTLAVAVSVNLSIVSSADQFTDLLNCQHMARARTFNESQRTLTRQYCRHRQVFYRRLVNRDKLEWPDGNCVRNSLEDNQIFKNVYTYLALVGNHLQSDR